MKIAFFGTSDRSLPILDVLNKNFKLLLCVTKNDTLVGRKRNPKETGVKTWARNNNIDFMCLSSVKQDSNLLKNKLIENAIELVIVADFSFIIPKEILDIPKLGCINIHFSLLPQLRGASPVQHAILNGKETTGITFFKMDEGMDTGDILAQYNYQILLQDTSQSIYEKLFILASEKLPEVINTYEKGKIVPSPQDNTMATYCYSPSHPKSTYIFKEDAQINWNSPVYYIDRQIRAFIPWPVAWTYAKNLENNHKLSCIFTLKNTVDKNLKIKIFSAKLIEEHLEPEIVQLENKNKTDWKSFLNGYALKS